jgi:hypothetical protein
VVISAEDSYVTAISPLQNFGAQTHMRVNNGERSFLRFDTSNIPSSAMVFSAKLTLCLAAQPVNSAGRVHELRRALTPWAETAITWSNQPAVSTSVSAQFTVPGSIQCDSVDVTTDVAAWVAGAPGYGWRISDADEATGAIASYATRDEATISQRPTLTVVYLP